MMAKQARFGRLAATLIILINVVVALCCVLADRGLAADPSGGGGSSTSTLSQGKIDLNRAGLDEIRTLPIPDRLARNIVEYRNFVRFYDNVYDLLDVPGMTSEVLARIKDLVATLPPPEGSADIARLSASYRQVRRYLGQEGANEGLVDEYLDMMRTPHNINELDLFDLQSFQNVSPVDAANIGSAWGDSRTAASYAAARVCVTGPIATCATSWSIPMRRSPPSIPDGYAATISSNITTHLITPPTTRFPSRLSPRCALPFSCRTCCSPSRP